MEELKAKDYERIFTMKQLQSYNSKLRSKYNAVQLENNRLRKKQESLIKKEVEIRTKEYKKELVEKDKIINDKEEEIHALKEKVAKLQSKLDNDASNSGIPTSKTPIGRRKYIPNTREKTNKAKGGQKGHKKHKLIPFKEEEITEIVEIKPRECNKCYSQELEILSTSVDKQELDYEVVVIRRKNKFMNCRCKKCGNVFHATIPNDLKEDIQYGKVVQSMAVCLTNEIYTPFNKTVKLVSGITDGEINMSESYVTKLQKRASQYLEKFIEELKEYIPNQEVYGWDDGVVSIDKKEGILRTYCTDKVALFVGHAHKNEEGLKEDEILPNTKKGTIVMHDHILHNYNVKYNFDNVECMIHLIRRLKKMKNNTNHSWCEELKELLSKTNIDRNTLIEKEIYTFESSYLEGLDKNYNKIIEKANEENKEDITKNYFQKEEQGFINDLIKYKRNYLLWAYDFRLPSTNNDCERKIRPVKSKMKISGQFQSIEYLRYYATIRSYIETCKMHNINIIDACVHLMKGVPYTLKEILQFSKEKSE